MGSRLFGEVGCHPKPFACLKAGNLRCPTNRGGPSSHASALGFLGLGDRRFKSFITGGEK